MTRALRINYPGAFYHVTSRGNEQKAVFKSKRDREKFLEYLETATLRYDAVIHVFCLMDNHYHLFLEHHQAISLRLCAILMVRIQHILM